VSRRRGSLPRSTAFRAWPMPLWFGCAAVFAFIALWAMPFCLTAAVPQSDSYVKTFEKRYRAAHTLQATFLERYTENGAVVRTEAGTAFFRRPGKMRWEYEAPEKDLFLVDGKTAWFYVPADRTATRVPAKQSGDWRTPLALLAGEMKVSRVCARVEQAPNEKSLSENNVVLRCQVRGASSKEETPRGSAASSGSHGAAGSAISQERPDSPVGSQNDVVLFEIDRRSGELARLIVRQSGGVEVEFRFENWHLDPPLPESLFKFEVPTGVAIVNGELPQDDQPVK
jgi:outer membrane lipoprotein-sorting protein